MALLGGAAAADRCRQFLFRRFRFGANDGARAFGASYHEAAVRRELRGPLRRRAAEYADRILRGTRRQSISRWSSPPSSSWVINLKSAKALGLEIPPNVLVLADEVIE